jgi:hypothetical protein
VTDQAEVVKEVGLFGLKSLITLNSGAIIVALTFIANLSGEGSGAIEVDVEGFKTAMGFYLGGVVGALGSVLMTYILAQGRFSGSQWFLHMMLVPAVLSGFMFLVGSGVAIASVAPSGS